MHIVGVQVDNNGFSYHIGGRESAGDKGVVGGAVAGKEGRHIPSVIGVGAAVFIVMGKGVCKGIVGTSAARVSCVDMYPENSVFAEVGGFGKPVDGYGRHSPYIGCDKCGRAVYVGIFFRAVYLRLCGGNFFHKKTPHFRNLSELWKISRKYSQISDISLYAGFGENDISGFSVCAAIAVGEYK